jgi:MoaA/NifB/PqqE/SkfB family radical SAM enzyme
MITLEDAERNLDDLNRLGVRIIDFTGGEPLLHAELPALLEMAKARGFYTTVTSNGLLYRKRAEQMAGLVDMLHFSIDSSRADEHDASRGVRCFDSLMASLDLALELGERPDLLFTVTNENVDRMEEIYETLALPNRLILIINPLFEYNALGETLKGEVMERMRALARRPYTYLNGAFLSLREEGGNDPDDPACRAVSTCVVISPFNELVLPCYHYGLERIDIDGRLYEHWHSDTVARHRAMEGRHDVCRGCTINCYFEPSFAVTPGRVHFWESLPSKMRYSWTKFVVQQLDARVGPQRSLVRTGDPAGTSSRYQRPLGDRFREA